MSYSARAIRPDALSILIFSLAVVPPLASAAPRISFDFREGVQGWEAGFADYPYGERPDYELEAELRELHHEATVWDNWFTLLALMLIYSVDVGLRRLAGLS